MVIAVFLLISAWRHGIRLRVRWASVDFTDFLCWVYKALGFRVSVEGLGFRVVDGGI